MYVYIKTHDRIQKITNKNKSNGTVTLLRRTYFSSGSTYLLPNAGYVGRNIVTTHVFYSISSICHKTAAVKPDSYQNQHASCLKYSGNNRSLRLQIEKRKGKNERNNKYTKYDLLFDPEVKPTYGSTNMGHDGPT